MILNEQYKKPTITFGLGKTEMTINLGETVRIWQIEIYNNDEYFLRFFPIDSDVYGLDYTPSGTGTQIIQARIISNSGKVNILSNKITLTVV